MNESQEIISNTPEDSSVPRLIEPTDVKALGINPEGLEMLKLADAHYYEKTRSIDIPRLPTLEQLAALGMSEKSAAGYLFPLTNLYTYLNGYAIWDKFGSDHDERAKWRRLQKLQDITGEELAQTISSYREMREEVRLPLTEDQLKEIATALPHTDDTPFTVTQYAELEEIALTPALKDFVPTLRGRMVDSSRVKLIGSIYEDINQFRGNRMTGVTAGIQLLAHKIFLQDGDMEKRSVLSKKGLDLKHLISQGEDQTKYLQMSYPEKIGVVREFERVIAEVLEEGIPESLRQHRVSLIIT